MQEVAIALVGDGGENRRILGRFALWVGLLSTAGLALVVFTPLASVWYGRVSGLSPELTVFSIWPGALLIALPFLESVLSFERGLLVKSHRTAPIGAAVGVQLAVTIAVFSLMILVLKVNGAISVGPALTAGYVVGAGLLVAIRRGANLRDREPLAEAAAASSAPSVAD
jgi:hypothetical protein